MFCCFFKCSRNFRAHALQSELNKVWYDNFVKFRLQTMISQIERAFKKTTKYFIVFILPTTSLPSFFLHFLFNFRKNISFSYLQSLQNLCDEYHLKISKTAIKMVKTRFLKKFTFSWNQLDALVFLFFFTRTTQVT